MIINGVTLPNIPEEVIARYQHICITRFDNNGTTYDTYAFTATNKECVYASPEWIEPILNFSNAGYLMAPPSTEMLCGAYNDNAEELEWSVGEVINCDSWSSCCIIGDRMGFGWDSIFASNYNICHVESCTKSNDEYSVIPSSEVFFEANIGDSVAPDSATPERLSIAYSLVKGYADQARRLTGTTDKMNATQVLEKFEGVEIGGGHDIAKLIEGTIVEVNNSQVNSIRNSAFYNCTNLTSVNFPACTSIGNSAFYNCINLTYASFPVCTTVKQQAFLFCYKLESINFPACETIAFQGFAFASGITIVDFPVCTSVGYGAFTECKSLTSVNLPACTSIGGSAFYYCPNLTSVNLPVCTSIGGSAFYSCSFLTSVNFPACTSIGNSAFYNCINLTSVNLPVCTSIGGNAFINCSNLTSVNLPTCITIGGNAFNGCKGLSAVSFPACTTIGSSAFNYCSSLTSVNLPVCTSIGFMAFFDCLNLKSVNFPTCTTIADGAFYNCINLTSVNLPVCTSIGSSAFYNCYNLSTIIIQSPTICSLYKSTAFTYTPYAGYSVSFSGTPSIYVPYSLVDSYKTATNWSYFSNYFSAIEILNGDILGSVNNVIIGTNSTKSILIPFFEPEEIPSITVTSNDQSIASVSNISATLSELTFDLTSYDVEGDTTITINAAIGDKTQIVRFNVTVMVLPTPEATVESLGTTYGFTLNDSGYYENTNKGVDNSYAICKLNIVSDGNVSLYLDCINYAENGYDYGILSTLDNTLEFNSSADNSNVFKSFKDEHGTLMQTVNYGIIPFGSHFIYIKFIKDASGSKNNDSLQFKARLE